MNVLNQLEKFYNSYSCEKGIIGNSGKGKPIYYFVIRKTERPVMIVQYAMHAREYITTYLAMLQIKDFNNRGKVGTVYFVPCVNPDGVEIALTKNPLYKANAFMVDLNVNFDARWGKGEQNVNYKNDQNYIGVCAFSEQESKALRDFTLSVMPNMTISYHSKGEEIYYSFHQKGKRLKRDKILADTVAKLTGYNVKQTPNSCGGYKDWCIDKLKIPALTIEVGCDGLTHPIKSIHQAKIFRQNQQVITTLLDKLTEI